MQIVYLWIENGRSVVKNQDLNFWSKYDFNIVQKEKDILLSYKKNPNYIENFWGNSVSELTAIVGRNGSGKSNILSYISNNISYDIGVTNLSYVCVLKLKGEDGLVIYNGTRYEIQINDSHKDLNFNISDNGRYKGSLISLTYPCAFIHYSPFLDLNPDYFSTRIDLSLTKSLSKSNFDDSILDLRHRTTYEQISFILNNQNVVDFELPKYCEFSFRYFEWKDSFPDESNEDLFSSESYNQGKRIINKFFYLIDSIIRKESDQEILFMLKFWKSVFFEVTMSYFKMDYGILIPLRVQDFKNEITSQLFLERIPKSLSLIFEGLNDNSSFNKIELFFKKMITDKSIFNLGDSGFQFEIENESFQAIKSLFDIISKSYYCGKMFNVSWSGLSTGETAFLNLFSKFYNASEEFNNFLNYINNHRTSNFHGLTKLEKIDNAVVLIDEGEVGLHPQWQKDYIKNLVKELPKLIPYDNIQIILTTNNPLILSDVPSENCIFLKKDVGITKVIKPEKQSFGGNIIDLFRLSFFVEGGLIGGFAKEKLNELAKKLYNDTYVFQEDELINAEKLVNLLGDEILKVRFKDLLNRYKSQI